MNVFKVLVFFSFVVVGKSYRILAINPFPGPSHSLPFVKVTQTLAKRGHEVTSISYYPLKTPMPNYIDVDLGKFGNPYQNFLNLNLFQGRRSEKWFIITLIQNYSKIACETDFASSVIEDFLNTRDEFDLIISQMFSSECFFSFAQKFKCPVIGLKTLSMTYWISEKFGNPTHPGYIPNNLLDYVNPLPFLERVENLLVGILHNFYYDYFVLENGHQVAKKYFGDDLPSLADFARNLGLFLSNTHHSMSFIRPLVPPIVEIGGVHLKEPQKLSNDLEKWINESTHGVIYFSLGSMIKGHTFPDEKREEFLKAFARLPQRVLWKWENETMPGKPDNVMIQKWMPQLDILCHPNVKAFISHGGLLGTTEAVHCGVPVMVMPQYGDQFTNAKALEANGGGVILHLYEATEEKVYNALKTILDPSFKKQAEELSARFRDRPMPPLETAIYWVEYVARHRGAHHMRTAAVGMPLYKYLLLDVIAFLLLVFGVISALFFYVTRAVFRKLFGKKNKKKSD